MYESASPEEIRLPKNSKKPVRGRPPLAEARYRRIAADLRSRIDRNEWPPGSALPSVRDLAAGYKTGEFTCWLAARALRSDGYISGAPRKRMIVNAPSMRSTTAHPCILEVLARGLNLAHNDPDFDALQRGINIGAGKPTGRC